MKVNIGRPPRHYNAAEWIERAWIESICKRDRFSLNDKDFTYFDHGVISIADAIQFVLNHTINKFNIWRGQKIRVHIDDWDIWSVDMTLAHIALPLVEKLRDEMMGFAMVKNKDVPEHLRATQEEIDQSMIDGTLDDRAEARWQYILNEIIFALEHVVDDSWEDKYYEYTGETIDNTLLPEIINVDRDGWKTTHERIENGLQLFGKYYRAMWD